jgi:arginyl-tRNA--protein-N-Asp/Glu arginylyltransferase
MSRASSYLKKQLRRNQNNEGEHHHNGAKIENEDEGIEEKEEKGKGKGEEKERERDKGNTQRIQHEKEEVEQAAALLTVTHLPSSSSAEKFALYKKYQVAVHGDEPYQLTERSFGETKCVLIDSYCFLLSSDLSASTFCCKYSLT